MTANGTDDIITALAERCKFGVAASERKAGTSNRRAIPAAAPGVAIRVVKFALGRVVIFTVIPAKAGIQGRNLLLW